ncbi:MAG: DUF2948 family protein [Alphaproteobacteria bacterium]
MTKPLKLRAEDAEDIGVISACLQDALIPFSEMAYLPAEQRFVLAVNRFKWENCGESRAECESYERVSCGLSFERVTSVRLRALDQTNRGQILELLGIVPEVDAIVLLFAGGGAIRLEVERILCHLEDFGEPWATPWRPRHVLDEDAGSG